MRTTFVLVRHGETEWNRGGRIQGHTDSRLTADGMTQAEAIGKHLASERFDHLLASDLGRAHHTAALIAPHVNLPIVTHQGLRERGFGIAEGKTYAEIERDHPEMFSRSRDTDPDYAAQGGESRRQFHTRITEALAALAAEHVGRHVLLVTHGGVLAAIFRWLNGLPIASPHHIEIPNAAYNRICLDDGGWQIEVWGSVAHLAARTDNDRV